MSPCLKRQFYKLLKLFRARSLVRAANGKALIKPLIMALPSQKPRLKYRLKSL
jgi:hypothetical protein